jgi:hypothetical protein
VRGGGVNACTAAAALALLRGARRLLTCSYSRCPPSHFSLHALPPPPPASTAALKFERAQAEADIGEAQAERNQLATLASRFKAALAKAGVKAKVEPLVVGDNAMVQRLWDSL